jgi:glycosyltransferase involved in cell wall biosynthesis
MTARFRQLAKSSMFHFLAISEYSATDIMRITAFQGKIWRWAYFTSIPDPLPTYRRKEQDFRVLWAGRMLGWKRVDTLIKSFSRLLIERPDATLTLVGEGPERRHLEHLAEKILRRESYRFLPPMPAPEIPKLMRQCHVYVLPSNAYEGWGAVVNEALAEGCAVIASEATGAAKTMIQHGVNGLLFAPGNWRRLGDLLCQVSSDETLRNRLAKQGQCTVVERWSPKLATNRFLSISNALLAGQPTSVFNDGPMVIIPKDRTE